MGKSPALKLSLKSCEPIVNEYVRQLELQNTKLQKQIAKLESKDITNINRIKALEHEIKRKLPDQKWEVEFIDAPKRDD